MVNDSHNRTYPESNVKSYVVIRASEFHMVENTLKPSSVLRYSSRNESVMRSIVVDVVNDNDYNL